MNSEEKTQQEPISRKLFRATLVIFPVLLLIYWFTFCDTPFAGKTLEMIEIGAGKVDTYVTLPEGQRQLLDNDIGRQRMADLLDKGGKLAAFSGDSKFAQVEFSTSVKSLKEIISEYDSGLEKEGWCVSQELSDNTYKINEINRFYAHDKMRKIKVVIISRSPDNKQTIYSICILTSGFADNF